MNMVMKSKVNVVVVVTSESLKLNKDATGYINHLLQLIGPSISQQQAYYIIDGLLDKMLINEREAKMIQAVIDRETLSMDMVSRDIIRANILKRLLPVINYY